MASAPSNDKLSYPKKGEWKSVVEIIEIVGFGRSWVDSRLQNSRYQPETRLNRFNCLHPYYSPECVVWLLQKAEAFRQKYPPIGNYVSLNRAGSELGHSRQWILTKIIEHKLAKPVWRRSRSNQKTECITPGTFKRLRTYSLDYAPAGWYNTHQLGIMTGWGHCYIKSHLAEKGVVCVEYLAENDRPYYFYAPEAPKVLGMRPNHYPPGGDNLTVRRMASLLDQNQIWVYTCLAELNLTHKAQTMLDDCNRPRDHYSQTVFLTLKRISDKERLTDQSQDSRKVG